MNIYELSANCTMNGALFIIYIPTEAYEIELAREFEKSADTIKPSQKIVDVQSVSSKLNNDYPSNIAKDKKKCKRVFMHKIMENVLNELIVENSIWNKNKNYIQIMFTLKVDSVYEEMLEILKENHVGSKYNSLISIVPCTLHNESNSDESNSNVQDKSEENQEFHARNSGWSQFLLSIRARLTVAQIVENIKHQAKLTFDFLCLLIIASLLCAIGLVENSNVYLISSMLISPMMGPVMASTFGKVIRNRTLQKMGVFNEVISLGISTIIGFLYGTVVSISTDKYGETDWPTFEMVSRGEVRTIGIGCLIALLSGAAVALAILSDNISSLVGVAISTSLMPPAVNAGLLWSLASVYYLKGNETTRYTSLTYSNYYSDNRAMELTSLGVASLCLTFVNIICIYLAGLLVFKIKEVAPIASRDLIRRQFWKRDIKIARNYNKTLNGDDAKNIKNDLKTEFADYRKDLLQNKFHSFVDDFQYSTNLMSHLNKMNVRKAQYTWSPCMFSEKKPTMQEVRELYNKIVLECDAHPTLSLDTTVFDQTATFSPLQNNTSTIHISQENITPILKSIDEHKTTNSKTSRKFIVTPCADVKNKQEYL